MSLKRFIFSGTISLLTVAGLYAGQIEIGGANGLSSTYMAAAANCTGAQVAQSGFAGCVAPVVTGAGQRTYANFLYSGSVPTQPGPNGNTAGLQLTDSNTGVTYSMVNNGTTTCNAANDGGCNFWSMQNNQSVVVPIGIFGVSTANIMLNDYWGDVGGRETTVTLNFSGTSNGATTASVAFNLVNGTDIRSAVICSGPSAGNTVACPSLAYTASGGVQNTNVFSRGYTDNSASANAFFHTQGNLVLDALAFSVPNVDQGLWLTSIQVGNVGGATNVSRTALTAITLITTPEPSTMLLMAAGCMAVLGYRRRKGAKQSV